jgi:hypothetical protein
MRGPTGLIFLNLIQFNDFDARLTICPLFRRVRAEARRKLCS